MVKRTYAEQVKEEKGLVYRTYNNDFEKRKKMINSLEKIFRVEDGKKVEEEKSDK